MPRRSPPWPPMTSPPYSSTGRHCIASRVRWPPACRTSAECSSTSMDGDAAAVWTTATTATELLKRVKALPGFGEQKARIFVALLGKQLGSAPEGVGAGCRAIRRAGIARCRWPTSTARSRLSRFAHKRPMKTAAKAAAPVRQGVTDAPRRTMPERPASSKLASGASISALPIRPDLEAFVDACIAGGVDVVQLRDKRLEARPLLERPRCRDVCGSTACLSSQRPPRPSPRCATRTACTSARTTHPGSSARRIVGADRIVGLSTHALAPSSTQVWRSRSTTLGRPCRRDPDQARATGTAIAYVDRRRALDEAGVPMFVTGDVVTATIGASRGRSPSLRGGEMAHRVRRPKGAAGSLRDACVGHSSVLTREPGPARARGAPKRPSAAAGRPADRAVC